MKTIEFMTAISQHYLKEQIESQSEEVRNTKKAAGDAMGDGDGWHSSAGRILFATQMTQTALLLRKMEKLEGAVEIIKNPENNEIVSVGHSVNATLEFPLEPGGPKDPEVENTTFHLLGSTDVSVLSGLKILDENNIQRSITEPEEMIISNISPMGMALLGKKIGDIALLDNGTKATINAIEASRFNNMMEP
jgi:transcription elongation GreA/GreB family factor